MNQQKRYRISLAIRRNPESLKPHTGQIVEYESVPFTVYTSSDKFVILDAAFIDHEQYIDTLVMMDKTQPFIYRSWIPHKKDGIETYPEYSGTIHGVMYNEFNVYRP